VAIKFQLTSELFFATPVSSAASRDDAIHLQATCLPRDRL